jgi:AcrR family transcriptional regulator
MFYKCFLNVLRQVVSEIAFHTMTALDPRVERTKAAVLTAAAQLLLDEGWDAVTHSRVAEVSQVGRATIYRHWPDAASLVQDTMQQLAGQNHSDPTGRLRDDLIAELEVLRAHMTDPSFVKTMVALLDRAEWDGAVDKIRKSTSRQASATLRGIVQAGIDAGELPSDCDLELSVATLAGPLMYRRLITAKPVSRAMVIDVVDSFLRGAQAEG